jgi:hypothetical protein
LQVTSGAGPLRSIAKPSRVKIWTDASGHGSWWAAGCAAEAGIATNPRLTRRSAPPLGFERKDNVRMRASWTRQGILKKQMR